MSTGNKKHFAGSDYNTASATGSNGRCLSLFLLASLVFAYIISAWHPCLAESGESRVTFFNKESKKQCSFKVEVAVTDEEQSRGLMFRDKLPRDSGMLFKYRDNEVRYFWMKNTIISLDLIFLNPARQVVSIFFSARPMDERTISSVYPAQYVLEVNAGRAKECGIATGTQARFFNINQ